MEVKAKINEESIESKYAEKIISSPSIDPIGETFARLVKIWHQNTIAVK